MTMYERECHEEKYRRNVPGRIQLRWQSRCLTSRQRDKLGAMPSRFDTIKRDRDLGEVRDIKLPSALDLSPSLPASSPSPVVGILQEARG
jgi:hypothetical protein